MHWVYLASTILMNGPNPEMRCKMKSHDVGICENREMICHIDLSDNITLESISCFDKEEIEPTYIDRPPTPYPREQESRIRPVNLLNRDQPPNKINHVE